MRFEDSASWLMLFNQAYPGSVIIYFYDHKIKNLLNLLNFLLVGH